MSVLDLLFGIRGSRCGGLLSGLDLYVRCGCTSGCCLDLICCLALRGCRVYVGLLSGFDFRLSVFDLGWWCLDQGWGFWWGFDWVNGALG